MATEKFALVIWEQTEESKKEYERARQRFREIYKRLRDRGFTCGSIGTSQFDDDGYPEFWLNDSMPLGVDSWCKNGEDASKYALKYGDTGWWRLEDLEQFADGKGPIFEEAMWGIGFRRSKRFPDRWARITSEEKGKGSPIFQHTQDERCSKIFFELSEGEEKRLASFIVMSNESAGQNATYCISVGKGGLIYFYLWVNPFSATRTEELGWFGAMLNDRGHIAKDQEGFRVESSNIKLGGKEMIYIKAVRPDQSFVECVWPSITPHAKLWDLARDLAGKAIPLPA